MRARAISFATSFLRPLPYCNLRSSRYPVQTFAKPFCAMNSSSGAARPSGRIAIIGAGNLGGAIIRGLVALGVPPENIAASARSRATLEKLPLPGSQLYTNNAEASADASTIVLCVKPAVIISVIDELNGHLHPSTSIISAAAGVPLAVLNRATSRATIRVMPTLSASVGRGCTGIAYSDGVPKDARTAAEAIFSAVGAVHVIPEKLMDAFTATASGGIAYALVFAEALADAGVRHGFTRQMAFEIAASTLEGAGILAAKGEHPAVLRNKVESPGGTTIAGTTALEKAGLRAAVIDAVDAAMDRVEQMNKEKEKEQKTGKRV